MQGWIRQGHVLLDGRVVLKPSEIVGAGDRIECNAPSAASGSETLVAEAGELAVLWHDDDLAILDKPSGLAMHPGAGRQDGTLAHRLLGHFPEMATVGHPRRPGIVHRLDIGTSGVVAVARTETAYLGLSDAFARRQVDKTYLAIAYGAPSPASGEVRSRMGRDPRDRKRMAVLAKGGREAVTRYRTVSAACGLCLLELDLQTGRTHQIRVHLKSLGHPLVGDPTYGEARWKGLGEPAKGVTKSFRRPALHAWRLALRHPVEGTPIAVCAPLPDDLVALWQDSTGTPLRLAGEPGSSFF